MKKSSAPTATLDRDNESLSSYFTGDVESLFKDSKKVSSKKSKIVLMLDASGSTSDSLPYVKRGEYVRKSQVVLGNAKAIKRILDEVVDLEGMNVVYETWAFSNQSWHMDGKEFPRFEEEYYNHALGSGGGTNIIEAFDRAHKSLQEPEVEGERLLIFATDGEVGENQIQQIKKKIMFCDSNTKALIVGIGANINGFFVREIVGNANILAEEHSDIVLMEAIMRLLGG